MIFQNWKWNLSFQLKNLEKALASSQEAAEKSSARADAERKELVQKLQSVEDKLAKCQSEVQSAASAYEHLNLWELFLERIAEERTRPASSCLVGEQRCEQIWRGAEEQGW